MTAVWFRMAIDTGNRLLDGCHFAWFREADVFSGQFRKPVGGESSASVFRTTTKHTEVWEPLQGWP